MSQISAELLNAYRQTDYIVDVPSGPIGLRIDQPSPALPGLLRAHGVTTAAFLTAWNPESRPTPPADNAAAQEALKADLTRLGLTWLDGRGQDPAGAWPPEPSLLILGIDEPTARRLAAAFRQNAFVWIGADVIPRLGLLR